MSTDARGADVWSSSAARGRTAVRHKAAGEARRRDRPTHRAAKRALATDASARGVANLQWPLGDITAGQFFAAAHGKCVSDLGLEELLDELGARAMPTKTIVREHVWRSCGARSKTTPAIPSTHRPSRGRATDSDSDQPRYGLAGGIFVVIIVGDRLGPPVPFRRRGALDVQNG
jgi:hypothetical protein